MNTSLVSVIVPAYNAQAFIGGTIQSVINQTYPDWEMLIVDDGSTDETAEVVKTYLSDSRIKYIYQANQERSAARNHGIRRAAGKYIAFLDADDLWLPDKLRRQVDCLDNHPEVGLCFTGRKFINSKGIPIHTRKITVPFDKDQFTELLKCNFIANSAVMAARTVFDQVGLFDESLPAFGSEDWDMWLRITRYYPFHFVDQPLLLYRVHEKNTSLDQIYQSSSAVLDKVFSDPTLPADIIRRKNRIYALSHFGFSETYLSLNQRKAAFRHWRSAVKEYPAGPLVIRRGLWASLKLCLPYLLIANLAKLNRLLHSKIAPE
jgi:glycosyltransferase involved in cell wall biosynthesis